MFKIKKGLKINVELNCRKFIGASFTVLLRCGNLSEPILCEIVLTKCLPISMYGVECFLLLVEQKCKLRLAFKTVQLDVFSSCPGILPCVKL